MKSRETDRKMGTGFFRHRTRAKIMNGRGSQSKGHFLNSQTTTYRTVNNDSTAYVCLETRNWNYSIKICRLDFFFLTRCTTFTFVFKLGQLARYVVAL